MDDDNLDRVLAGLPDEFFERSDSPKEAGSKKRAVEPDEIVLDDDEDAVVSDRESAMSKRAAAPPPAAAANNDSEEPIKAGASSLSSYIEKLLLEANAGSVGPMVLDGAQRKALDAALSGTNMFITGPAGSGKSALLREIDKQLTEAGRVVNRIAYNGVAAANINGMTIHSFCGLGAQNAPPFKSKKLHTDVVTRVKGTETLIIDEFSTLSGHFFDGLDLFFRQVIGVMDKPFGGIQIIVCGDFAQIKPVDDSKKRDEAEAAMRRQGENVMRKNIDFYNKLSEFERSLLTEPSAHIDLPLSSKAWRYIKDNIYYLDTPHRQGADPKFLKLLNEAREGSLSEESHRILESKVRRNIASIPNDYVMLFAKRVDVATHNDLRLKKLPAQNGRLFKAVDHYENEFYKSLLANVPLHAELELRVGCRVMLKRNLGKGLVNGSCGTLTGFTCCPASDPKVKGVMRPIQGLVFDNPAVVKNRWSIPNYKQLQLPAGANAVSLRATSPHVMDRKLVMDRIEQKFAEQDSFQAHVYAINGFLPLPVVMFDSGEYLVCTPTEWSIEVTRREEIVESTEDGLTVRAHPPTVGASGEKVTEEDMRRLSSITGATTNGGAPKRAKLMPKRKKTYRLVPVKLAFRIQIPLHVAYAVSVHASIGLTLPKLCVDLGTSIFQDGMAYVGLSRGTSLDGIVLRDYYRPSIRADSKVGRFYAVLKNRAFKEAAAPAAVAATAANYQGDAEPDDDGGNLSDGEQFRRLMARRAKQSVAKAVAAQEAEFMN